MSVTDPDGPWEVKSARLFQFYFNFMWNIERNLNQDIFLLLLTYNHQIVIKKFIQFIACNITEMKAHVQFYIHTIQNCGNAEI